MEDNKRQDQNQNIDIESKEKEKNVEESISKKTKIGMILLIALVPIMCLIVIVSINIGNGEYKRYIKYARASLEANEYNDAIQRLQDAIDIEPKKLDAYIGLVDVYITRGAEYEEQLDFDEALEEYKMAETVLNDASKLFHSHWDKVEIENKMITVEKAYGRTYDKIDELYANDINAIDDEDASNDINEDNAIDNTIDNTNDSDDNEQELVPDNFYTNGGDYYEALHAFPWQYSEYSEPHGGVIIVYDWESERYGAIDYDGNVILPTEYKCTNKRVAPTEDGYFVLKDEKKFVLFDHEGNQVFVSNDPISAGKDFFAVTKMKNAKYESLSQGWYCDSYKTDYYNYDLKLVTTVECEGYSGNLFYRQNMTMDEDGNLVLHKIVKANDVDYDYAMESITMNELERYINLGYDITKQDVAIDIHGLYRENLGYMDKKGNIEWVDVFLLTLDYTVTVTEHGNSYTEDIHPRYINIGNFSEGLVLQLNVEDGWRIPDNLKDAYNAGEMRLVNNEERVWRKCDLSRMVLVGDHFVSMDNEAYRNLKDELKVYDPVVEICGTYTNGSMEMNYDTYVVLKTEMGHYVLTDIYGTDLYDMPNVLGVYDYLEMANKNKLLVCQDGKWGFADHEGKVLALYEGVSAYVGQYAGLIEDGMGFIVDENMNKLECIGPASSTWAEGELLAFDTDYGKMLYSYKK